VIGSDGVDLHLIVIESDGVDLHLTVFESDGVDLHLIVIESDGVDMHLTVIESDGVDMHLTVIESDGLAHAFCRLLLALGKGTIQLGKERFDWIENKFAGIVRSFITDLSSTSNRLRRAVAKISSLLDFFVSI
jgi:hypothetical protein